MSDKNLRDDMLKLVQYKILFVKRDYEHVFKEVEELVPDNTDGASYTAWKIAEFIQKLGKDSEIKVPKGWEDYLKRKATKPNQYTEQKGPDLWLTGIPEDDKKYLRVFYEVMDRYPRERFRYEEEQIKVLKQIRDNLPAWSERLPAVGDTILAVLRRVQRYLSASELRTETREPLAAVRDSLRTLEAAGQVQRRGSRYGLPEW